MTLGNQISQPVTIFHGRMLPENDCRLAGYAALIAAYDIKIPLPNKLAAISSHHRKYETDLWRVYTPRHYPNNTLASQLTFALKYEGVNLLFFSAFFSIVKQSEIEEWVKNEPTGQYSRRIWFLYEWLTEKRLNLPDLTTGNFVNVLDPKQQYEGPAEISKRHRIRNNLPGIRDFCPLVWRTEKLEHFKALKLDALAKEKLLPFSQEIVSRAAAFLLLNDTKASFAIEGERPAQNRAARWGRTLNQAGTTQLTLKKLLELQEIMFEDQRFIRLGLRKEGGFIGVHDRLSNTPLPDHISAKWQDLPKLISGLLETYEQQKKGSLDKVILATLIAFGFVFIHPFEDGNGRIHRYLIQHVLAECGFSQKGLIFPISSVILDRIEEYKKILESYSKPRLEFIEWTPTEKGNIEVINNTIDLYRYFDATLQAEFLYECIQETVEKTFPKELHYLIQRDEMKAGICQIIQMPDYLVDLLIGFLNQNHGKLSKRARDGEFKKLTNSECSQLEALYQKTYKTQKI